MKLELHYSKNNKGEKGVFIPIKQWEAYQKKVERLEQERKIKRDLKIAFKEADDIKHGMKKGVTLKEFLKVLK